MPITSVSSPAINSLNAAYNPIIIEAVASAAMPIVYCDIYFNNIFYKTISKTLPLSGTTAYRFDIQDAVQEIFADTIPFEGFGGTSITSIGKASCKCSVRGSTVDVNNLTVPDGIMPIQGTGSQDPVSGAGGVDSNTFFVLNAALQITDNQDFATHLNAYKTGDWSSNCFPLTHRKESYIGFSDYDTFPVFLIDDVPNAMIAVRYRYFGQVNDHLKIFPTNVTASGTTIIPSGTKNIGLLGFDMSQVANYNVELWNAGGDTIATSPRYIVNSFVDYKRIWFKNYLGQIDGINFLLSDVEHASSSSNWQRSESYPSNALQSGKRRISINSNDTYTAICSDYLEQDMGWIDELFDTPLAVANLNGYSFESIVISDQKYRKFQQEDRYRYDIQLQFEPANKRKTLRS